MKCLILIPTYNERENITKLIPEIFRVCPEIQVMVVDDNSPDKTAEAVRTLQSTFPKLLLHQRSHKQGLGQAYRDAFARVLSLYPEIEVIGTMDADFSHPPEALTRLSEAIHNHDFVIGSRYITGGQLIGWETWRKLLSGAGNRYCRLITRLPIKDCTSGFGLIRTSLLKKIDFTDFDTTGYAFLMYLKYKAWKEGARLYEVPITFKNRVTGESKISLNIIQEGLVLPWKLIKKHETKKDATCPLCQNSRPTWWFTKNHCDVWRCADCKLLFVSPLPTEFTAVYSEDYFCGAHNGFGYINYDEDKKNAEHEFTQYINKISQFQQKPGTLLDVGAATGAFVSFAQKKGWQATGVEISDYAAATARAKGLDVTTGTLADVPAIPNSLDVITLWDVFEHIPNPTETLEHIHRLLKPNGILAMNMPNARSWYARIMGKYWPLIIPPEHIRLYNPQNLEKLLCQSGFTVTYRSTVGKRFSPAYIFQILYTIGHHKIWQKISTWVRTTPLNHLAIPINLKDNMYIIATKQSEPRTQ